MKIICIGRNYAKHAKELNNDIPDEPMIFMKPSTALLKDNKPFYHPEFSENIHYEVEVVLKIAKNGKHIQPKFARDYYKEVTLGIDLTARDLQQKLRGKGHPWETSKSFDQSAVLGEFVPIEELSNPNASRFELHKNGKTVQDGNTKDMLFSFDEIISYASKFFTLQMGDLIYTGTPEGVGQVKIGEIYEGFLHTKNDVLKILSCEIK